MSGEPMTAVPTPSDSPSRWQPHPWVTEDGGRVRFGVFGGPFGDWRRLRAFVREAEAMGADSYWIPDHPTGVPDWAPTLAAIAASTRRIRLGPLVACVPFRTAHLLARQAADVDRISGGRLVLGLGIGHHAPEFTQIGVPFPSLSERQAMLDETIDALRALWSGEPVSIEGRWVRLDGALLEHGPVQRPWVPLLIAGGGRRVTLRRVAERADAANLSSLPPAGGAQGADDARETLTTLQAHCREVGRPEVSVLATHATLRFLLGRDRAALQDKLDRVPDAFRGQFRDPALHPVVGTPRDAVPHFQALVDAGLRYFIVRTWMDDLDSVRLFAEDVLPELRVPPIDRLGMTGLA